MDKKNENEKKDTKKYIIIGIAAVAVLAIGIIIGVVIGNSGKKDNDKQVSSDPVGTVVDNSGNTTQVDEKNSDSNTQTENKDNIVSTESSLSLLFVTSSSTDESFFPEPVSPTLPILS